MTVETGFIILAEEDVLATLEAQKTIKKYI